MIQQRRRWIQKHLSFESPLRRRTLSWSSWSLHHSYRMITTYRRSIASSCSLELSSSPSGPATTVGTRCRLQVSSTTCVQQQQQQHADHHENRRWHHNLPTHNNNNNSQHLPKKQHFTATHGRSTEDTLWMRSSQEERFASLWKNKIRCLRKHPQTNNLLQTHNNKSTTLFSTTTTTTPTTRLIVHLHNSNNNTIIPHNNNAGMQHRSLWTWIPTFITDLLPTIPFWGHSAALLKTIHMDGVIPYWACFPILNVLLRITLFPLVIHSAHVGVRFSKVAPDLQLLFAVYARDYQRLRIMQKQQQQSGTGGGGAGIMTSGFSQRWKLASQTMRTMSQLLKYNRVNPLTFFYAPILQIPVYYYIANDLRRVVRGADPDMAQDLTDAPVHLQWISTLTEADPWNVLPCMAGLFFYLNLEHSLAPKRGERPTMLLMMMKDVLQSIAVLTPAFLGSAPAGMQLYACTTFVFTGFQSALIRNNTFRSMVGLTPIMLRQSSSSDHDDPVVAEIQRKREEELKHEIIGKGVLQLQFQQPQQLASNDGTPIVVVPMAKWTTRVQSSIPGSATTAAAAAEQQANTTTTNNATSTSSDDEPLFIHGISAPKVTGRHWMVVDRLSFDQDMPPSTEQPPSTENNSPNEETTTTTIEFIKIDDDASLVVERKEKKPMPVRKQWRR